jgi:hypothetical protein
MCRSACIFPSNPSDVPSLTSSMSGASSMAPLRASSAFANAPCESMQKKQSFAAETAVASISRS